MKCQILSCLFLMSQTALGDPIPSSLRVKRHTNRPLFPVEKTLPGRIEKVTQGKARISYRKKAIEIAFFTAHYGMIGGLLGVLVFQGPQALRTATAQISWKEKLQRFSALNSVPIGVAAGSLYGVERYRMSLFHEKKIEALLQTHSLKARSETISNPHLYDQRFFEVMEIFSHLVTEAEDLYPEAQSYLWDIILVENDDLDSANAHSWPGGVFAIDSGILKLAGDRSAIAAILGHEIGHTLAQHAASQIKLVAFAEEIISPVNLPFFILGSQKRWKIPSSAYAPLIRKYEREADLIGLVLMARAGYDPLKAVQFWNQIYPSYRRRSSSSLLSTHPHPSSRKKELARWVSAATLLFPQETRF